MSQRHQVYVAFKDYSGTGIEEKARTTRKVIGMHHGWLYGMTAATQAIRMMRLALGAGGNDGNRHRNGECDSDNPFYAAGIAAETLLAIYSFIPEQGYYSRRTTNALLSATECRNPQMADNNNGITVFDFCDLAKPAFCLMALNDGQESVEGEYQPLVPMGVSQWLELHYPANPASHWQAYRRQTNPEDANASIAETLADCRRIVGLAEGLDVISPARIAKLFPAMYKGFKPAEEGTIGANIDFALKDNDAEDAAATEAMAAAFAAGAKPEDIAALG